MEYILTGILTIIAIVAIFAFSFLCTAGIIWLICWTFGLTFTLKIAFGVWLVLILARSGFEVVINKKS